MKNSDGRRARTVENGSWPKEGAVFIIVHYISMFCFNFRVFSLL